MATLAEIRSQYPQYNDMADEDLASALHSKFYSDMPRDEFNRKVGIQSVVGQRFGEMQAPANAPAMQEGLEQRATQMTTGPRQSAGARMVDEFKNVLTGAEQRTSPVPEDYKGKLLSTDVHIGDGNFAFFRDPQTKEMVRADRNKHAVLRDPADGRIKVYARSPETDEGAQFGVAQVLAPGLVAGAPTARAAMSAAPGVKASDIFSTAKPHYRAGDAELAGKTVPGEVGQQYVSRVQGAMDKANVPEYLAPEVYKSAERIAPGSSGPSQTQRLQAEMNWEELPTPPPADLSNLRGTRELVGQSFKSHDDRVRQGAGAATREIDKIVGENSAKAAQHYKTADEIQSVAHSLRKFDALQNKAGMTESRKLFRGRQTEKMREYLGTIVNKADDVLLKNPDANVKVATGFERAEIEAFRGFNEARPWLRYAAEASPTRGILRGSAEAVATAHYGPVAAAIPAIGYAANTLSRILDTRQLGRMRELIAKRSPAYAEAVEKSVTRFEKAQLEFLDKPSPNNLAALVATSRALSSGLTRDGIPVTSGELLKAIQGPVKSAAEGEEPAVPGRPGE
jgi:hypothetical protein